MIIRLYGNSKIINMIKLEKLYSIIENSREMGVKLNKDVLQQVEELEEGIIKNEILPALGKDIAPRLEPIKRDLVLVVEYHPGEPIGVRISRKMNIAEDMGAKQLTLPSQKAGQPFSSPSVVPAVPHEPTKQVVNHTEDLKVTFPDGTMICEHTAKDTMIRVLQIIGLDRVAKSDIKHGGGKYGLVSKEMRPVVPGRKWQHKVDGWYIYTNINNQQKKDDLKQLSEKYKLGLVVEE